jgi:hypothetical protein
VPLSRRRLVTLVAAVAVAGLAASGCAAQAAAVKVGGDTVSRSDFEDELDAYSANDTLYPDPEASGVTGELAGSYGQDFVADLLQQRIFFMLAARVFDERGLDLTGADRSAAADQLDQQLQGSADDFPSDLRDELTDDVARLTKLQEELGAEGFDEALIEAADGTDIEVSSHYGSWDPDQYSVVPPEGPAPAPGDGGGEQPEDPSAAP